MATKTKIVGTIADTDGSPITGKLGVKLNAPLIDTSTTPDTVYYSKTDYYDITNGDLGSPSQNGVTLAAGINLLTSDEVTYQFTFTYPSSQLILYLNGVEYNGYYHLYTDSNYYTGEVHSSSSVLLTPYTRVINVPLFDAFNAKLPTTSGTTTEWSSLQPSGINSSNIDTSLYYIAQLIVSTSTLLNSLISGIYTPSGIYDSGATYELGDVVYDPTTKGSYWYIYPTSGNGLLTDTTKWQILITSTEVTSSTVDFTPVFLNTAFDSSWNGITNKSPTADVLYDYLITLAQLNGATFTDINVPTKATGTNTDAAASTKFVQNTIAAYTPPAQTTVPDIGINDVSSNIVNSRILKTGFLDRIAIAEERLPQGSDAGSIPIAGYQNRVLNTLVLNNQSAATGLTGGYIQIPAGTYFVEGYSCVSGVGRNRAVLVDSSGNFLALGTSENTGSAIPTNDSNHWSYVCGRLDISASLNITIRHYAQTVGSSTDLGKNSNFGGQEIYARLIIHRIK